MSRMSIGSGLALVALAAVVALVTVIAFFPHSGSTKAVEALPHGSSVRGHAFPSAADFGDTFVRITNQYAQDHSDPARVDEPDCVQASPGRYMCSYAVLRAGAPRECHLMQARWTPQAASTITITLAGRTTRCGSLSDALDSLD